MRALNNLCDTRRERVVLPDAKASHKVRPNLVVIGLKRTHPELEYLLAIRADHSCVDPIH